MPLRCDNCDSIFFKTLETRVGLLDDSLMSKKRCKRCKFKYLFSRNVHTGLTERIDYARWQQGERIAQDGRARVFCSEYSQRISRHGEATARYLDRIRHAEGRRHDAS